MTEDQHHDIRVIESRPNSVIIIEGPMACGKTRNAGSIARYFRCHHIVEGDFQRYSPSAWAKLEGRILVLTNNRQHLPVYMRIEAEVHQFSSLPAAVISQGVAP